MRLFFYTLITVTFFHQVGHSQNQQKRLRTITSPYTEGSTLYIQGPIDSHIYDYLSYMRGDQNKIKKISLNSFGGSHYWALEIARRIQALKVDTEITAGNFCASACVYLFGSGKNRIMSQDSWIGIHGARLSGGHRMQFDQICKIKKSDDITSLNPACVEFISDMKALALKSTLEAFELIQASGVSASLKSHYFSLGDDPLWYQDYNVIRKPDWTLNPEDALFYNLATSIQ